VLFALGSSIWLQAAKAEEKDTQQLHEVQTAMQQKLKLLTAHVDALRRSAIQQSNNGCLVPDGGDAERKNRILEPLQPQNLDN
jgi:hypothetical protein